MLMLKMRAKLKKEEKENMSTNHQQGRQADSEGGFILFYDPETK